MTNKFILQKKEIQKKDIRNINGIKSHFQNTLKFHHPYISSAHTTHLYYSCLLFVRDYVINNLFLFRHKEISQSVIKKR